MPSANHRTLFNTDHAIDFGLKIMQRNPDTKAVVSVCCQFCVFKGHEDSHPEKERKWKQMTTIMSWQGNFRTDHSRRHLTKQHCQAWKEYQLLSFDEKNYFFKDLKLFNETRPNFNNVTAPPLLFTIKSPIIDIIIGQMFFNPVSEHSETARTRALKLFKQKSADFYEITINNQMQFQLCIGQISRGNSFQQVSGNLMSFKEMTGLAQIGSVTDEVVSDYARQICAINLQRLATLL